ncbi:MAG: hypothetical protein MUF72_10455 [Elainella sp. Prado103]|nr:hypothetical protein [Elainella sp. Prado103]
MQFFLTFPKSFFLITTIILIASCSQNQTSIDRPEPIADSFAPTVLRQAELLLDADR